MPSPEPIVVAQLHPVAATLTSILFTSKDSLLGEFVACNKSSVDDRIRFMLRVPGTESCDFYIFHDVKVKGDSTFSAHFQDQIPRGTIMKVYSLNGTIDFTIFTRTL
jgi:ferredoxin-NADP reductase